ncbi:uncharacterized protein LOC119766600 [Culex quinquefasciatus]|uniref:uncharacterized protein LOC119766600 n=1 Tax=Culex quinquefasciatus TaxID=7176 RepID=UPI0018E37F6B|nr:uncharacterized protein LOC119766600 [Culex quinquefasciatus]
MSSKSSCTTGPTMSASFRATPVDVRHEASNTTRSFVVVLSGLKTQWCGRSGFADSRFSSPRKRLMAVDLDSPRRWTAYFFWAASQQICQSHHEPSSPRTAARTRILRSSACSWCGTFPVPKIWSAARRLPRRIRETSILERCREAGRK